MAPFQIIELLNSIFIFVFAISAVAIYFNYKKEQAKRNTKIDDFEDGALKEEINGIKQRLAVLEKIITDKNYDLNEQFSELRRHV